MPAQIEILLADDNPGDIRLAWETLKDHNIQNNVSIVRDGEEALRFLRSDDSQPQPDLVLLNLTLPKVDGTDVLSAMRNDERLRHIPVIIMIAGESDRDMLRRLDLPDTCLVVKPFTIDKYLEAIRCYPQFGIAIVRVALQVD